MSESRDEGAPGFAGASSLSATPETMRIVAVAWATAAVRDGGGDGGEEVASAAAARMTMSTTNALARKW